MGTLRVVPRHILALIALAMIARGIAQALLPLMHQEAYYWMYAQHPSLSYFDHPPMVAWVIGMGTSIFGDTEFGVRVITGLFMLLNGGLMYAFAREWWGREIALAAAALMEVAPVYYGIGLLATMDAMLLTFWLVGLVGFSMAVRRGTTWAWYLCGFGLGGALLSKYTGIFLVPGVGLLLLWHKPWRKYLTSPHPYLAVLLGLLMFSPVLLWNWQHDWASFRFQFLSRFESDERSRRHTLLEFLGTQVGVGTPIVIGGFAVILYRGIFRQRLSAREKMALAFSVALLLSVAKKAWAYPVHIDWAAPAYLSFMPGALQIAAVRIRAGRAWPRLLWRQGAATLTLQVCVVIDIALIFFLIAVQPRTHTFRLFGPWDQLAARVEQYEDALETRTGAEPLIIVDGKYELASLMAFYRNRVRPEDHPAQMTVNQVAFGDTALGYAYWTDRQSWRGKDCIFVDVGSDPGPRLAGWFDDVTVKWTGIASNGVRYSISECHGYRG